MNRFHILSHSQLLSAIEADTANDKFRTAAEHLLQALNDWPNDLKEPTELIAVLKNEVKDKLTYTKINEYSKHLEPKTDAWKMEAVTALLEMFDLDQAKNFDGETELELIIDLLTRHYG